MGKTEKMYKLIAHFGAAWKNDLKLQYANRKRYNLFIGMVVRLALTLSWRRNGIYWHASIVSFSIEEMFHLSHTSKNEWKCCYDTSHNMVYSQ